MVRETLDLKKRPQQTKEFTVGVVAPLDEAREPKGLAPLFEIVEEDNLLDSVTRVGERLLENLRGLERAFPGKVTNARGRGMFLAFDLPDTDLRNRALKALSNQDVLGLSSGHRAIRFRPALLLSEADADEGVRRVERALGGLL